MTGAFRRSAYQAVEEAKAAGLPNSAEVVFDAPPGTYRLRLGRLKDMLYQDRKHRRPRAAR